MNRNVSIVRLDSQVVSRHPRNDMTNFEQENDAMLSAAMDAFMDDFSLDAFQQNELIAMPIDTHGGGQSQACQLEQRSSLSSQNVMAETVNQRKRRRKKKGENNMTEREELLYLRSMVQTLTQRLTALDPLKSKLESVHTSHDELVCAVWEDLTRRQRAQREHSESENVKLRGLLDEQLVLTKEFVQLVARRQRNLEPLVFLYGGSPWWGAFSPTAQPSYDLLQSLDELYDEVDTIVRDPRFQSPPVTNPQQELRLRCNERGVYVEITESCEVPFAFEEATDLFWTAVTMDGAHHDEIHEETTYCTANTLVRSFRGQPAIPNTGDRVYGSAAHRQFVEPRRVTIVGRIVAQPEHSLGEAISGIAIRHQIWHVLEPSPVRNSTYFRTYHLAIPELYENASDEGLWVGVATNFLHTMLDFRLNFAQILVKTVMAISPSLPVTS